MTTRAEFDAWAVNQDAPRVTDWLQSISEPDWSATVNHPFFDALAQGQVSGKTFAAYMVQDYGFVDPFTALLGHAIGNAPSMADRVALGRFVGMLTSTEDSTFQRTFDTFGVPTAEQNAPNYLPETRAFRALLEETGQSDHYPEILAVLVVTEWIYWAWATRVTRAEGLHPLMAEWIDLHDNRDFQDFVCWLRRRLDEEADQLDGEDFARVAARFRKTVAKERAFHDAVSPVRGGV